MKNKDADYASFDKRSYFYRNCLAVIGYLTEHLFSETLRQLLCPVFLYWLVYTFFRTPQDDDDWAGQY